MDNKELHKIAPTLSKLKEKGTGFKVPNNYFNSIEQHLASEIELRKAFKTTSFKTPENYFESVEDITIERLEFEKFKPTKNLNVILILWKTAFLRNLN